MHQITSTTPVNFPRESKQFTLNCSYIFLDLLALAYRYMFCLMLRHIARTRCCKFNTSQILLFEAIPLYK